jgi:FKBP-type peptidyl-prolyl cis-trans isomerase FkpA
MDTSATKRTIFIIVFVVVGAGIIAGAMWYANNMLEGQPLASQSQTQDQVAGTTTQDQAQNQTTTNSTSTKNMDTLKITDVTVGTGAVAQNGDVVTVNYTGTFDDGTVFDSSLKPGHTPFSFTLGTGGVIKGWDLGVLGMKVGGKRELVVPPDLGYGPSAYGPIPGGSTLHFTVELLSVSSPTK